MKHNILLIDDDSSVRSSMKTFLEASRDDTNLLSLNSDNGKLGDPTPT